MTLEQIIKEIINHWRHKKTVKGKYDFFNLFIILKHKQQNHLVSVN